MRSTKLGIFHGIALFLGATAPAFGATGFDPSKTILYKEIEDIQLHLHVFEPAGDASPTPTPAVVFFHGEGWHSGTASQFFPQCAYLAERGMIAISADYRVRARHQTSPRDAVADAKSAIRWVRENAEVLGVDPHRIAAAGGHIAAAAAMSDGFEAADENPNVGTRPDALILFNPVLDNGPDGFGYEIVKDYWQEISPLHNVTSSTPPTVMFLGTADQLVPVATVEEFGRRMQAAGRRYEQHLYPDQSHGFFNYHRRVFFNDTMAKTDVFLVALGYLSPRPLRGTPKPAISLMDLHRGTVEIDEALLNSYTIVPQPVRDYFAPARRAFEAEDREVNFSDPTILEAAAAQERALLGGPMLGDLTHDSVSIWVRPATAAPLKLTYWGNGRAAQTHPIASPRPGEVSRVVLEALSPSTAYQYRMEKADQIIANGSFVTAPRPDDKGRFRIAFGADFHKIGLHNPKLFQAILARDPALMLLLGDSAADDRRENMNLHRADYLLRDSAPTWANFVREVPVYASWDDHDYFDDDLSGLQDGLFSEGDREAIRAMWLDNWNNPPAPADREGIYFKTRVGPVEVFMLDTRSCRDHRLRGEYGSYLGKAQQRWLVEGLRASTAPFKILASGTMWSDYVSRGKDSWATWDTEALEEVFGTIEAEHIGGVLLLSGDRHGARGFQIPRDSGFNFIELGIGSLGGIHGPPGLIPDCSEQIFGYDGQGFVAFGEFDFDTTGPEPKVTFRLISEEGATLEEITWSLASMTPQ